MNWDFVVIVGPILLVGLWGFVMSTMEVISCLRMIRKLKKGE